jgi:hypothetical protein
MLAAHHYAEYR